MGRLTVLLAGIGFGIVLTKSQAISWFRIHKMFTFQEAHMYLIMFSAVAVGAVSILLIKKLRLKTIDGEKVEIREKPFQKGIIFGGFTFGLGWAITGSCPGPIYAQIGAGEYLAFVTLAGALLGAYLYAWARPRLPH